MAIPSDKAATIYLPHVLSVSLGIAGTLFGYFSPALLGPQIGEHIRAIVALSIGLYTLLLTERYFVATAVAQARDDILAAVTSGVMVHKSASMSEAVQHITINAARCRAIYNPRLRGEKQDDRLYFMKEFHDQDAAIIEAFSKECDYHFVIDKSALNNISLFRHIHPFGSERYKGKFVPRQIETDGKPILQMILLDYVNGERESIVGWEIGSEKSLPSPIISFRDTGGEMMRV